MQSGYQALITTDRYFARDTCIEVTTLDSIYEMLVELRMLYGDNSDTGVVKVYLKSQMGSLKTGN